MTDHYAVVNAEDLQPVEPPRDSNHTCEICGKNFNTSAALGVHFRTHGSAKKPCPECGVEYFPGPGMERHRQARHGATKLNGDAPKKGGAPLKNPKKICPDCHRPISSKDLARHRRVKHGIQTQPQAAPAFAAVPSHDNDMTVDEVFDAVVGVLFPRGVIPITAMSALIRWREATERLLHEVNA